MYSDRRDNGMGMVICGCLKSHLLPDLKMGNGSEGISLNGASSSDYIDKTISIRIIADTGNEVCNCSREVWNAKQCGSLLNRSLRISWVTIQVVYNIVGDLKGSRRTQG
jgi:hypothetical protein